MEKITNQGVNILEVIEKSGDLKNQNSLSNSNYIKNASVIEKNKGSNLNSHQFFREITQKSIRLSLSQHEFCIICEDELEANDCFLGYCGHSFCNSCILTLHKQNWIKDDLCPLSRCNNLLTVKRKRVCLVDNFISNEQLKVANIAVLSNTSTFLEIVKKEKVTCIECDSNKLVIIENVPFRKCLNCCAKICHYCNKLFDAHHFNVKRQGKYCKVALRTYLKKNTSGTVCQFLISMLLSPLFSYFCLVIYSILRIAQCFEGISKVCVITLVSPLIIGLFVLLLPFFPIVYCIR